MNKKVAEIIEYNRKFSSIEFIEHDDNYQVGFDDDILLTTNFLEAIDHYNYLLANNKNVKIIDVSSIGNY
jgi:GR25 family glycosyltransferase involved in LPS biosynthesis